MVRAGSSIDIYFLRYEEGDYVDVPFRASSVDNAIITGTRKALKSKLKSYVILDDKFQELFHAGLGNY